MSALKSAVPLQLHKKDAKLDEIPLVCESNLDSAIVNSYENKTTEGKDSDGERFENNIDIAASDDDNIDDEENDIERFGSSMCTCKTATFFPHRALRCAIRQTVVEFNSSAARIKAAGLDVANQATRNLAALKETEEDYLEEGNYDEAIRL
eukprot:CAMPEP_0119037344 /NCGR_PEP_ID=MMETSP1177-20130426/5670_1 /TAXON_ID=2985 /ORGANISM="Ochromonas sp, Strain CCMP1899" /LENGTH=150 /DNA_ID=CAMNT_0006998513 /DNA_START=194 /DNA_END=646 /DNA_ORIENTATION=-